MASNRKLIATGIAAAVLGGIAVAAALGSRDDSADPVDTVTPVEAAAPAPVKSSTPKNVILLVGDGMGASEQTIARDYGVGAAGRLNMDGLPFTGDVTTYSLDPTTAPDYKPLYVPDSAPTATAWSTGRKTIDDRLSQGPSASTDTPGSNDGYETTFEIAEAAGMKTGDVSTAEITDATPAAPGSHISQRDCQGPADMTPCGSEKKVNGGLGSIAEQLVDHGIDVILGGGRARFDQPIDATTPGGGASVREHAVADLGYAYVQDAAELAGLQASGEKVLGLFNAGNMTKEYAPLVATRAGAGSPTTRCKSQSLNGEPTLGQMTDKALELLADEDDGFFLQVEGASIDKQAHAADVCGQIGETLAFDDAVGIALDYQRRHPDTLVVVTADHSQSSQIVPLTQTVAGLSATVQTVDGQPMKVSYGASLTAGAESHTGATVNVAAIGPGAASVTGLIDQTELFATLTGRPPGR